ncbi:MAG: galactitol-1-phosphate 5-dehydrogenase [Candidatus Omnitrophica bacterium]|nr:galactitol-1-phosphate 5-dehydrogenase [Candidatus Omnitrophota bacterium]
MKALVLEDYKRLVYKDVPLPETGPEEVLVQVKACGICGSDVHGLDGSTKRRQPPLIMGHEASGCIVETGSHVNGWQKGDRVTFDSTIYCGRCFYCRQGFSNRCEHGRILGVACDEYRRNGAFAEYIAVPQHILYRLPEGLSFEHAATMEPLSIAFHGVNRTPLALNHSALVMGTGVIGLLAIQALRLAGCGCIIGVDVIPERLKLARQLGADHVINAAGGDSIAQVLELTEGRGVHVAIEAVGVTETIELATRCLRKGGSLTIIGNLSPSIQLPLQVAVMRELSVFGSCASSGEYPACLEMLARGSIRMAPLISAVAPLSDGGKWFERLYNKEPGLMKVILRPDQQQ